MGTMQPRSSLAVVFLALVASAMVPTVAGHAAPQPLANEVHVLEDDAQDEFYWYDGYDLHHLHVREAYWKSMNHTGLVFRFTLYGGFAPGEVSNALHIDLSAVGPDGNKTVRFTTPDDTNWSSPQGMVLFSEITEDEAPYTGVTARLQVLVPYEVFGAEPGDTLEEISMRSYADDDLRDAAPGGIFVPGSGGAAEVPVESTRHVDALELTGPSGYIDVETATDGTEATFAIENKLGNGQHVSIETTPTPGWNVSHGGFSQASLDANDSVSFLVNATTTPAATAPLPVHIYTDLGGHRTYYLGVNGTTLQHGLEAASVDVAPEQPSNESPGPAVGGLLAVLGAALVAARRRGR